MITLHLIVTDLEYAIYIHPINDLLKSNTEVQKDLNFLMERGVELIGLDYVGKHQFKEETIKTIEEALKNSNKISNIIRKKSDFMKFVIQTAAQLPKAPFIIAFLRIQNPLESLEEISKAPCMADSNWGIPDVTIMNAMKVNSEIPLSGDLLRKLLLKTPIVSALSLYGILI